MFLYFMMQCLVGFFPFVGWFLLIYSGEMVVAWVGIVPSHPEWAVPLAYILMVPAASFALRKAINYVRKHSPFNP
jgi:hypothetical protein